MHRAPRSALWLVVGVLCACGPGGVSGRSPGAAAQGARVEAPAPGPETPAATDGVAREAPGSWWARSCPQGYVDVAAGMWHRCAVCATGTVHCQGSAAYDALGAVVPGPGEHGEATVAGIDDAVEVDVGLAFGCARTRAGAVLCWGWNRFGQLGRRLPSGQESSWQAAPVDGVEHAEALAIGHSHACALRGGAVWCWGRNGAGQLGSDGGDAAQARPVPGVEGAVQVAAGLGVSCARLETGEVMCWGDGRLGQLGTPERERSHVPVLAPDGAPAAPLDVSTDGVRVCVLGQAGEVLCWGGGAHATAPAQRRRLRFPGGERVLVIGEAVCAHQAGGLLACVDAAGNGWAPHPLLAQAPVRALSTVHDDQGCGLWTDGAVFCWGMDEPDGGAR